MVLVAKHADHFILLATVHIIVYKLYNAIGRPRPMVFVAHRNWFSMRTSVQSLLLLY